MDSPAAADFEANLTPILPRAYAFAVRLAGNADDAQDLVQDAAVAAFSAWESFQAGTNFKAWFLRILFNRFLNRKRQLERRPQTVAIDDAEDLYLYQQARQNGLMTRGSDPAAALLAKMDGELIAAALADLPDEFRAVATLSLMGELSYEAIAEILGCPVGTVRSRLHRARKLLQKNLGQALGMGREASNPGAGSRK